jgi:triacylglycerol esterase/lipase EstA (alpha/beta hydrolase family)
MLAYPCGLPGWDRNISKIHFVGHSMGSLTVRYLQHLLKIGYFDEIDGTCIKDRSSMVASITSLAGANNGSIVVGNCGMSYDRNCSKWVMSKDMGVQNDYYWIKHFRELK